MNERERDSRVEAEHAPAEAEDVGPAEATEAEARDGRVADEPAEGERRRAAEAERELSELRERFAETEKTLAETRKQLEATERRQRIDQSLMEADAVDLEAARLLTEMAVEQMEEADVQAAVDELRQRKPHLFRQAGTADRGAMAGKARSGAGERLDDAAETAAMSGDRRDLLRYLRMRRRGNGRRG